jgi:iron(III) transport system substrate-binding protein
LDRYFEQAGHAEEIRRDSEGDFSARRLTGIAVIHSIAAAMDPTKEVTMSLFRLIRWGGFLVSNALLIFAATSTLAASAPMSPAELALYQRADREKILIEGAKKEGQFTLYDSHTWFRTIAREFEKKYPFIKVSEWRSDGRNPIKRALEEIRAGQYIADVIATTSEQMAIMKREGVFQEYTSVDARHYLDEVKAKGKNGFYYIGHYETYNSLGFNTSQIPPAEAPKTMNDLLNPKWKGKMSIVSTTTGTRWIGNTLNVMGREFLEKMADQEVQVQNMSGAALAGLVVSGEVPLSPTIFDANIHTAKQKGAPVEWRPLEPVVTTVGYSGLTLKAPRPHAGLLFLDYLHSKEGQQLIMKGGLWSPREDVGSLEQKFKKSYIDEKYSLDEAEKKFAEWDNLMQRLFIKRR